MQCPWGAVLRHVRAFFASMCMHVNHVKAHSMLQGRAVADQVAMHGANYS